MQNKNLMIIGIAAIAGYFLLKGGSKGIVAASSIPSPTPNKPATPTPAYTPQKFIVDAEIGFPHWNTDKRPPYPSNDRADYFNVWNPIKQSYERIS